MVTESTVILLAEDDESHAVLVKKSIARAGISNQIVHVSDGQQALDYVRRQGAFAGRKDPGPTLILLDINMPGVNGVEVLKQLRGDRMVGNTPILMLAAGNDPTEVRRCYELGCSVYIAKPVAETEFVEAVRRLGLFLQIVQIPRESRALARGMA